MRLSLITTHSKLLLRGQRQLARGLSVLRGVRGQLGQAPVRLPAVRLVSEGFSGVEIDIHLLRRKGRTQALQAMSPPTIFRPPLHSSLERYMRHSHRV